MNLDVIISKHTEAINKLNDRVAAIEYILTQTLAVTLSNDDDAKKTLADMRNHFGSVISTLGISVANQNEAYKSAKKIFDKAEASHTPMPDARG